MKSTSKRITHHVGDQCSGGHFAEADLRECVAWLENRPERGNRRRSERLSLKSLLAMMRQAGWECTHREYLDPLSQKWVTVGAFSTADTSLSWESTTEDEHQTELGIYRTACVALSATPTEGPGESANAGRGAPNYSPSHMQGGPS